MSRSSQRRAQGDLRCASWDYYQDPLDAGVSLLKSIDICQDSDNCLTKRVHYRRVQPGYTVLTMTTLYHGIEVSVEGELESDDGWL